jgi:DNA modification methylase
MNQQLAQGIIQDYTKPGDTVLDPMAGIGTTGIEASRLGRNAVLNEYEPRFVNETKKNIKLLKKSGQMKGKIIVMKGDARKLTQIRRGRCDVVVTSPPFEDTEPFHDKKFKINGKSVGKGGSGESYSPKVDAVITSPLFEDNLDLKKNKAYKNPKWKNVGIYSSPPKDYTLNKKDVHQIGNLKGEQFQTATQQVYSECYKSLKPGGKMIVHMKNPIRNKKIVRLDKKTLESAESVGFRLAERKKRPLKNVSFWMRNYWKKYPDAPKVKHEDILVFRKPKRY